MKGPLKLLTGLIAGVSLGLLFAPKKGQELRKELSKSSDKMGVLGKELLAAGKNVSAEVQKFLDRKDVRELINSGKAEIEDLFHIAKKKGKELSDEAKKELLNLGDMVNKKVGTTKKVMKKKVMPKAKKK